MKLKNLTLILMLGVILATGFVSAIGCNIDITNPNNDFVDDSLNITWEVSGESCVSIDYDIYLLDKDEYNCNDLDDRRNYSEEIGNDVPFSEQPVSLNLEEKEEGDYCVLVSSENDIISPDSEVSDFTVDHTAPEINYFEENLPESKSIESDTWSSDTRTLVNIDAEDNEGIVFCEIEWGDGKTKNCSEDYSEKNYGHQYKDSGEYELTLTVRDAVGHEATETTNVEVENVNPEVEQEIEAPNQEDDNGNGLKEASVGEVVKFTAKGSDVKADVEAGLTCIWTFDNGTEETTADENGNCEVNHTWSEASIHTVDLTIEDKDGGSVDAEIFELEILEPILMTPTQKGVINQVFKFDLDEPWDVPSKKRFKTDFSKLVECQETVTPNGMNVTQQGPENRCQVDWTPSEEQKGKHLTIIKVMNKTSNEIEYYSFETIVYSWGIELEEGWNLISIPYMPTDTSIDSVFGGIVENIVYDSEVWSVFQYDAVEGKWLKNRPYSNHDGFYSSRSLQKIVPGYGYWVKMENEDTLYGVEENFPIDTTPGETGIDLATESWNLVGRYGAKNESLDWEIAFKSLRHPFYDDNYVGSDLGIYELDSVTANGDTTWSSASNIVVAQGYWVRTAAGSEGREKVFYEPNTI